MKGHSEPPLHFGFVTPTFLSALAQFSPAAGWKTGVTTWPCPAGIALKIGCNCLQLENFVAHFVAHFVDKSANGLSCRTKLNLHVTWCRLVAMGIPVGPGPILTRFCI